MKQRKPVTFRFRDDGETPNNPKLPLVIYRNAVVLDGSFDPAAVFQEGRYDQPRPEEADHDKARDSIRKVKPPRLDPLYGKDGPLSALWET